METWNWSRHRTRAETANTNTHILLSFHILLFISGGQQAASAQNEMRWVDGGKNCCWMNICIKSSSLHPSLPVLTNVLPAARAWDVCSLSQKRNIPRDEWITHGLPTWLTARAGAVSVVRDPITGSRHLRSLLPTLVAYSEMSPSRVSRSSVHR